MGLMATEGGSGGDFTPAPEGTHIGRCVKVIDLGTQPGSQMYPDPKHKVMVAWELPSELHEYNGEQLPFLVTTRYTMSLHEKASLRKVLESWRGRAFTADELAGFDLKNVAGKACMLSVIHTEDGKYANVSAVTSMVKGLEVPPAVNPVVYYEIEDGDSEAFRAFSPRLQETIRSAPEWTGPDDPMPAYDGDDPGPGGFDDSAIPFMPLDARF